MLLVIDVGNSNNVIGLFSRKKLLTHWRIRTEWNRTADEYWVLIKEFILLNNVETETIDDIVINIGASNFDPLVNTCRFSSVFLRHYRRRNSEM